MVHYHDLEPCDYFGILPCDRLLAVGWLENGFEYPKGNPGEVVYVKLEELLKAPWQPVRFMGWHSCDLCRNDGFRSLHNLFIPGPGVTYVAPQAIVHYISAHGYRPPNEFCEAVLSCPDMGSDRYIECLRTCGWERYPEAFFKEVEHERVRERERSRQLERLQLRGDSLMGQIEEYRIKNGRLPAALPDLGVVAQDGGAWQYEVMGETTIEFLQRLGSALGLFNPPRQAYRIRFVPSLKSDFELGWSSEFRVVGEKQARVYV